LRSKPLTNSHFHFLVEPATSRLTFQFFKTQFPHCAAFSRPSLTCYVDRCDLHRGREPRSSHLPRGGSLGVPIYFAAKAWEFPSTSRRKYESSHLLRSGSLGVPIYFAANVCEFPSTSRRKPGSSHLLRGESLGVPIYFAAKAWTSHLLRGESLRVPIYFAAEAWEFPSTSRRKSGSSHILRDGSLKSRKIAIFFLPAALS